MFLKITSAQNKIFAWDIQKVSVPTEAGEITILPGHEPLTTVVRWWLIKILPTEVDETQQDAFSDYIAHDGMIVISVAKGLLLVDGETILITTSVATATLQETEEILQQMQQKLETDLKEIRAEGSVEDIEKVVMNLEKVRADLKLIKLQDKDRKNI